MIIPNRIYEKWLIDCVEDRKWSWPRIALCLVHIAIRDGTSRRELLDDLKADYQELSQRVGLVSQASPRTEQKLD